MSSVQYSVNDDLSFTVWYGDVPIGKVDYCDNHKGMRDVWVYTSGNTEYVGKYSTEEAYTFFQELVKEIY